MASFLAETVSNCGLSDKWPPDLYACFVKDAKGHPKIDSLQDVVQIVINVIQILLAVAGAAAVIMIIYGGIMYIASNGEQDRIARAKDIIVNSVVGLIIALVVFPLVTFIGGGVRMSLRAAVESLGTPEQLGLPKVPITGSTLQNFITTLFIIAGGLSVLFIVIGALKYVVSGGDPKRVSTAKETILYAVIGLIVSIAAVGIVEFVVKQV